MKKWQIPAAILGSISLAGPVAAGDKDTFQTIWLVEPQQSSDTVVTVNPGEAVVEGRLVPTRLLMLEEDAIDSKGKLLAKAGTPLMGLMSTTPSACSFSFLHQSGANALLFGAEQAFICYQDTNRDGKFDSVFQVRSQYLGLPPSHGKTSRKYARISGVAYSEKAIGSEDFYPRLKVKYADNVLQLCVSSSMQPEDACFEETVSVSAKKIPANVSILGSEIHVMARTGKSITLQVTKSFEKKPFVAHERTSLSWLW